MKTIRHPVAGMVIFVVLVSLCVLIYSDFEDYYGIESGDDKMLNVSGSVGTGSIMYQLNRTIIMDGINEIAKNVLEIKPPTSITATFDLVGALAGVGIGFVKTLVGLVTIPFEITGIIIAYYSELPSGIITILLAVIVVYVAFILLSLYLNRGNV